MNNGSSILQIPVEDIVPNRFQPRKVFDETALNELADSIRQHGIIQPLVLRRVQDKYEIIAGERRYRAAQIVGLMTVPAIITNLTDEQSAEVAIVENVQRKDLSAIEEAKSFKAILDKGYVTQDELARKLGVSQSAISNKLRLLSLDDEVQDAVIQGKISERHARSLLKIDDKETQKKLLARIIKERLTVKQLDGEIKKIVDVNNSRAINNQDFADEFIDTNLANVEEQNKPVINADNLVSYVNMVNENKMPDKVPNKFFNYMEDYSTNMNMPENNDNSVNIFNVDPQNVDEVQEEKVDTNLENNVTMENKVDEESNPSSPSKFFGIDELNSLSEDDRLNIPNNNAVHYTQGTNNHTFSIYEVPGQKKDNIEENNAMEHANSMQGVSNLGDMEDIEMLDVSSPDDTLTSISDNASVMDNLDPFVNIKEFLSFDPKLTYREYMDASGKHLEISVKNN